MEKVSRQYAQSSRNVFSFVFFLHDKNFMNSSSFLQTFHNLRCTNMSSLDLQQVKCFTNCKEALTQLRKEFESTCNFNSFMNENTELTQRWISVKEHSAFPSTSKLEHAVQCTRALQVHVPLIFPGAAIRELRSLITRKKSNFIAKKMKKQNSFQLNIIAINPINTSRALMP